MPRDRERLRATRRRYRERHAAAVSVARKAYRDANRDKERAKQAAWYQANREERCTYTARYAAEHPDRQREFQATHRERMRGYCARRRALRLGCLAHHTDQEWADLCRAFGDRCVACGGPGLERDHVRPLAKGGDDTIANIQPLCRGCNARKGVQTIDYRPNVRAGLEAAH